MAPRGEARRRGLGRPHIVLAHIARGLEMSISLENRCECEVAREWDQMRRDNLGAARSPALPEASSGTSILRWWAASPRGVSVEVVATKEGVTGLFASSCGVIRTFGRLPRSPSVSIGRESGRNREGRPSERAPFGRLRSGQPLPAPAIESRRSSSGGPHPLCENISILLNRS
jgi:hypothetical protein